MVLLRQGDPFPFSCIRSHEALRRNYSSVSEQVVPFPIRSIFLHGRGIAVNRMENNFSTCYRKQEATVYDAATALSLSVEITWLRTSQQEVEPINKKQDLRNVHAIHMRVTLDFTMQASCSSKL